MVKGKTQLEAQREQTAKGRSWALAVTSFFFVLLQSACTAVIAISGVRLVIGVTSLAAASSGLKFLVAIHGDAIRIPMLLVAVVGSVVNLYVLWRIRSLRARPSSQWRVAPVTREKRRAESIQLALAVLTLLLVAAEWTAHIYLHGSV